jgi:DNA-binding CsgD family transcriptional regulator/PAS domain-containing protein
LDQPPAGEDLTAGELARLSAEVLGALPFPALVLEVPSQRIVSASPAAATLLAPDGGMVVGHLFEDFTADRPAVGNELLAGGRVNGFETFRVLRRSHSADVKVRVWIRTFDRQPESKFVVVVLVADQNAGGPAREWADAPAVVGMTDASLLVERISNDAEELFGRPVSDLLGSSLVALIDEDGRPSLLAGLSEASASQAGVTLYLDLAAVADGSVMRCELLLLPLKPAPSCAFVFLPTRAGAVGRDSTELSTILLRLGRGAQIAELARGVFRGITETMLPGLSRLTTRELEIATHLVDGERPPEIAQRLFLSQSTVRNHLSSVFAKLGVASQHELVTTVRQAQSNAGRA